MLIDWKRVDVVKIFILKRIMPHYPLSVSVDDFFYVSDFLAVFEEMFLLCHILEAHGNNRLKY